MVATDTFTYATDQTVRMRHTSTGDLQILSMDGKLILDQIPKAELDRAFNDKATMDEPSAECRGFVVGMFLSSLLWVGIFFLVKWIAGA